MSASPVVLLGHAGGWDELLLIVAVPVAIPAVLYAVMRLWDRFLDESEDGESDRDPAPLPDAPANDGSNSI
ncbi:MAG: hypothetical protein M3O70_20785 [Actinomycetota bacterium]|nr:hypothetical protein [Actinomycetota bacterium]